LFEGARRSLRGPWEPGFQPTLAFGRGRGDKERCGLSCAGGLIGVTLCRSGLPEKPTHNLLEDCHSRKTLSIFHCQQTPPIAKIKAKSMAAEAINHSLIVSINHSPSARRERTSAKSRRREICLLASTGPKRPCSGPLPFRPLSKSR
jgi:hypothetical protein